MFKFQLNITILWVHHESPFPRKHWKVPKMTISRPNSPLACVLQKILGKGSVLVTQQWLVWCCNVRNRQNGVSVRGRGLVEVDCSYSKWTQPVYFLWEELYITVYSSSYNPEYLEFLWTIKMLFLRWDSGTRITQSGYTALILKPSYGFWEQISMVYKW